MTIRRARRDIGPTVLKDIERRLLPHAERFPTLASFCTHVGIDQSVLTRWRAGSTPGMATYLDIIGELDQLDQDVQGASGGS